MLSYELAEEFANEMVDYAEEQAPLFFDLMADWLNPETWDHFLQNFADQIEDIRQPVQGWTPSISVFLPSDFAIESFIAEYGDAGRRGMIYHMEELLYNCIFLDQYHSNSSIVSMSSAEYDTGGSIVLDEYGAIDGCKIVNFEVIRSTGSGYYIIDGILMTPELGEDVKTGRLAK